VNVVVEACYAGSFIYLPQTISKPGRVVMTSTGAGNLAYASSQGAIFTDYFVDALWQGQSLYLAFRDALWAAKNAHPHQTPWLDDNGNGIPNEVHEGQEAALRGFAYPGTLSGAQWPPYIVRALSPTTITQGQGTIYAEVRDDEYVKRVWAAVYPPSYRPPETGAELVYESPFTLTLSTQGDNWYTATYTDFTETGEYRLVIFAEDGGDRSARPMPLEVRVSWKVYLPLVLK